MKQKNGILYVLTCILFITILPGLAYSATEAVKIGDITSFSGKVMVRSAGEWSQLTDVPFPIYKTDKVVTKAGRAEILLVDTGTLRMDRDSNITIAQRMEGTGKRCECVGRQVNVLVGNVVFDINLNKKGPKEFKVRTPNMIAAIRGTTFPISVNAAGNTSYDVEGDATVTGGNKTELLASHSMTSEDITATNLPAGDPQVASLAFQQIADRAVSKGNEFSDLLSRANAMQDVAEAENESNIGTAANLKTRAAKLSSDAYLTSAEASVIDSEASVMEVKRMNQQILGKTVYYRDGEESLAAELFANLDSVLDWFVSTAVAADNALSMDMSLEEAQTSLTNANTALELAREQAAAATLLADKVKNCLTCNDNIEECPPSEQGPADTTKVKSTCSDEEMRILATAAAAQAGAAKAAAHAAAASAIISMNSYLGTDAGKIAAAKMAAEQALMYATNAAQAAERAQLAAEAASSASGDALALSSLQAVANQAAAEANNSAASAQDSLATAITQETCAIQPIQNAANNAGQAAQQATEASEQASAALTVEEAAIFADAALNARNQADRAAASIIYVPTQAAGSNTQHSNSNGGGGSVILQAGSPYGRVQ